MSMCICGGEASDNFRVGKIPLCKHCANIVGIMIENIRYVYGYIPSIEHLEDIVLREYMRVLYK